MTGFAYDDLQMWRGIYPKEVLLDQFEKLTAKWALGIDKLKNESYNETKIMAIAAYSIFRSARNQIRFYLAREKQNLAVMADAARDEIWCATELLKMMDLNSAIGFEAANHYFYSKGCLREKVINCQFLLAKWGQL